MGNICLAEFGCVAIGDESEGTEVVVGAVLGQRFDTQNVACV